MVAVWLLPRVSAKITWIEQQIGMETNTACRKCCDSIFRSRNKPWFNFFPRLHVSHMLGRHAAAMQHENMSTFHWLITLHFINTIMIWQFCVETKTKKASRESNPVQAWEACRWLLHYWRSCIAIVLSTSPCFPNAWSLWGSNAIYALAYKFAFHQYHHDFSVLC